MSLRNEISRRSAQLQHLWMGRPDHVIFFGQGIGDDLLCTAVARELKKRGARKIAMLSRHAALFEHNADLLSVCNGGADVAGRLRHWGYSCIIPQYSISDPENDRDIFVQEHLIATMCRIAGLTGSIDLRSYITLLAAEKKAGRRFAKQAVIQSSGRAAGRGLITNKNWFPDRYQAVSDQIADSMPMIQLGEDTDPPIRGALDWRGKTSLRESAAILACSEVFIGQVGFLMHLARAVDCRSVIVYGGREDPFVSGYRVNENVVGRTICSPCWQRNRCDYGHECMRMIEADAVVAAVRRQLERVGTPLEVERVDLDLAPNPPGVSSPLRAGEESGRIEGVAP
jgi:hypothetical protein